MVSGLSLYKGNFPLVCELAKTFLDRSIARQDAAAVLVGHRMVGLGASLVANSCRPRRILRRTWRDTNRASTMILRFASAIPTGCVPIEFFMAQVDNRSTGRQFRHQRQAIAYAHEIDHVNTRVYAECVGLLPLQCRRDVSATASQAAAVFTYCKERRMLMWCAWASIMLGWAVGQRGENEAGVVQISENLADLMAGSQD